MLFGTKTVQEFREEYVEELNDETIVDIVGVADCDPTYIGTLHNKQACLVHALRHLVRSDEHVAALRECGDIETLGRYLEEPYQHRWADRTAVIGEQYPEFWDEVFEMFIGPVSTNAMGGVTWRLKDELKTSYARSQGALARTALEALQDSMYVFQNGGPETSFPHRISTQLRGFDGPVESD